MRIDSRLGIRGQLFVDSGDGEFRLVPAMVWCDDSTGEFVAYRVTKDWVPFQARNGRNIVREHGAPVTWKGRGKRIRFVHNEVESRAALHAKRHGVGAAFGPTVFYHQKRPCEHPTCVRHGPHTFATVVEEAVEGGRFERARLVKIRYYCSWHYRPPVLLAPDGGVLKTFEEVVRP